jgi:hypothetical protein
MQDTNFSVNNDFFDFSNVIYNILHRKKIYHLDFNYLFSDLIKSLILSISSISESFIIKG